MAKKIERKYLAHYLDASFGDTTANYVRLGKDLEELNEELNPDVEVTKNILGEQNIIHKGYEVQSEVDPFYAYTGDALYERLAKIANERLTSDDCKTTKVDVLLKADGSVEWAYKEDVYVIPNSIGGDTSGVQIPFTVYNAGNRVRGAFDPVSKAFGAQIRVVNVDESFDAWLVKPAGSAVTLDLAEITGFYNASEYTAKCYALPWDCADYPASVTLYQILLTYGEEISVTTSGNSITIPADSVTQDKCIFVYLEGN